MRLGVKAWWMAVVAAILMLTAFTAIVSVFTWHMAAEEAEFKSVLNEARAREIAEENCLRYVAVSSKHKTSSPSSTRVLLGMIGAHQWALEVGQTAIRDFEVYTTTKYQYRLYNNTSAKHLVKYVSQLYERGVRVFVVPNSAMGGGEEVLNAFILWARARQRPQSPIVIITPIAAPVRGIQVTQHLSRANLTVVRMTPGQSAALSATLLQMNKQGIESMVALVCNTTEGKAVSDLLPYHSELYGVKLMTRVWYDPDSSMAQILNDTQLALTSVEGDKGNPNGMIGIFVVDTLPFVTLDEYRMLEMLQLPWFFMKGDVASNLFVYENLHHSLRMNTVLFSGDLVDNTARYVEAFERMVLINSSHSPSPIDIAVLYDSMIVASFVGSWMVQDLSLSLKEISQRTSIESNTWVGLTGTLKLSEDMERLEGCFMDIQYSNTSRKHLIKFPSGLWELNGYIHAQRSTRRSEFFAIKYTSISSQSAIYLIKNTFFVGRNCQMLSLNGHDFESENLLLTATSEMEIGKTYWILSCNGTRASVLFTCPKYDYRVSQKFPCKISAKKQFHLE